MSHNYFVEHSKIWDAFHKRKIGMAERDESLHYLRTELFAEQNPDINRVLPDPSSRPMSRDEMMLAAEKIERNIQARLARRGV